MNKKKLSEINLLEHLNQNTINAIRRLIQREISLTNTPESEYIVLCKKSSSSTLHNGIIAFSKSSYSLSEIGLFSIYQDPTRTIATSPNTAFKFYSVTFNSISYIAIKKPIYNMDRCMLQTFLSEVRTPDFFAVKESDLTDIVAL